MQTTKNKNLPKRARYYQGIIDVDNTNSSVKYTKLKDTYIIFLCLDDIFGKKLPVYFFENICRQDKQLKLNDRAFKVFFNAKECDKLKSDEEKSFFKFLQGKQAESDFTKSLEEKIFRAKQNEDWRRQYMTWQQTIDEEKEIAFEEGLQQGAQAKAIENARNLLRLGVTTETVAQGCSLPLSQVLALQEELSHETAPAHA